MPEHHHLSKSKHNCYVLPLIISLDKARPHICPPSPLFTSHESMSTCLNKQPAETYVGSIFSIHHPFGWAHRTDRQTHTKVILQLMIFVYIVPMHWWSNDTSTVQLSSYAALSMLEMYWAGKGMTPKIYSSYYYDFMWLMFALCDKLFFMFSFCEEKHN